MTTKEQRKIRKILKGLFPLDESKEITISSIFDRITERKKQKKIGDLIEEKT